jgi:hypothetical protein
MSTFEVAPFRFQKRVALWRKALAAALDVFFAFHVAGYVVGLVAGDLQDGAYELDGVPALILFALVAAYFLISTFVFGGTIWQRLIAAPISSPRR